MQSEITVTQTVRPLVKASDELSQFLGIEKNAMLDAIKAQCFKGKSPEQVTDAQLATYVSVANALKLNPLLPGMMYPYPDRNGSVTVMIGPDGVFKLLSDNSDIVAQKDGGPAWWTEHGKDESGRDICTAYINHRTKGLFKKTIWVDEWVVSSNPNWVTRRHHQSEIRALKQAARMVIHGIPYDQEEAVVAGEINVTPDAPPTEPAPARVAAPKRSAKGAAAVVENEKTAPVIDIPAAPVPTPEPTKAAAPEPKAEAPKAEPKAAEPAAPEPKAEAKPTPRAFLKDGEVLTVIATVSDVTTLIINQKNEAGVIVGKPSIQAKLKGDYIGEVKHIGGATGDDPEKIAPLPVWANGATVKATLRGRLQPKSGKVIVLVDAVEAVPANPAAEVE